MKREEEIKQELKRRERIGCDNPIRNNSFLLGALWADAHPVNHWHKVSEELPHVDTEVVCKMKGVLHTEHFICKWDGKYWWHWGWLNPNTQGWFGLNEGWEVTEWKEI